jgi:dihydroneopterin aldolase
MGIISLHRMAFFAHHGCFEEERITGTAFEVDVDIYTSLKQAAATDNLLDTLDYQAIYDVVKKEMQCPSNLLEHVAGRIIQSLCDRFGGIDSATVTVRKQHPPLGGNVGYSAVTLDSRHDCTNTSLNGFGDLPDFVPRQERS